jgi:hypothetical protein
MKNLNRFIFAGLACLTITTFTKAMVVKYNDYLVNESGLAYNKSYPIPMNSYAIDRIAFMSVVSSVTFNSQTFTDGQRSTGTITVANNTILSSVSASDYLTVVATLPTTTNVIITLNGVPLYNTTLQYEDTTTTATAINIKNAINALVGGVVASTGANNSIVYATATIGGYEGNSMRFTTNISTAYISFANYISSGVTGSVSDFRGGKDNEFISIGNKSYIAGINFAIGGSAAATAGSLATAINNSSMTTNVVASTGSTTGIIVYATSTYVGANTNYVITTSSQTALKIGGTTVTVAGLGGAGIGQMWGGSDSAYTLVNTSATVISISSHGFMTGLAVLYSTPSNVAIGGLQGGTTYYVIALTPNAISLATTSALAQAGTAVILTSSQTKTTADSFGLTASPLTGNTTQQWQVSNDGSNWINFNVNSLNTTIANPIISTYLSTGSVNVWDMGDVGYSYLRLNVGAPTTGAVKIKVIGNGKNTSN